MHNSLLIFLSIFLALYGLANFYVGFRLWQALKHFLPGTHPMHYWSLLLFLAATFPLGRFGEGFLPFGISDKLTIFGSYWLAFLYYLFILLLLFDILRLVDHYTGILPAFPMHIPHGVLLITTIVCALVGYGVWNARSPVIQHYDIAIPKNTRGNSQLHVVMVSDIHLGKIVDTSRLSRMVDVINQLHPDIVLLPGDIIDEDVDLFVAQKMPDVLRRLQAPLGAYGVLGNHEYIGRKPDLAVQELSQGGIVVLRDQFLKVADYFYIVGRDDRSLARSGSGRKSLEEIMAGMDRSLPIILLDHQPFDLYQAETAGVDLQLSGHTHRGQFFPNSLITHAIYEVDRGYLRKNTLQVIVSSGFGTWGPPFVSGTNRRL